LAKRYRSPVSGFSRKFTPADVILLAETDTLHGTLSGPATRCLMRRAWSLYADDRFERLAHISVSHLYNLRGLSSYPSKRMHWTKTIHGVKPSPSASGARPPPRGAPASSASTAFTRVTRTA
jgi:hypothetical protein